MVNWQNKPKWIQSRDHLERIGEVLAPTLLVFIENNSQICIESVLICFEFSLFFSVLYRDKHTPKLGGFLVFTRYIEQQLNRVYQIYKLSSHNMVDNVFTVFKYSVGSHVSRGCYYVFVYAQIRATKNLTNI